MGTAAPGKRYVILSEKVSAATLLVVFTVLGLAYWNDRNRPPPIPAPVTKTIDSLDQTAPAFDSTVTTRLAEADRRAETDRRLARRERALQALADTLKARKDSLARDASEHPDSALAWRATYAAADSLATARQVIIDTLRTRVVELTVSRDSLRTVAVLALERLDVTTGVNTELRTAIAKLTTRKLWDYVAVGCGAGLRGPDCIVGLRIPLQR